MAIKKLENAKVALSVTDDFARQPGMESSSGPTHTSKPEVLVIPVVQERVRIGKRKIETGRVQVLKTVREKRQIVDEPFIEEEAQITRVVRNELVDESGPVRYEGETLIVPVYEERVVVQKRLALKEELHIRIKRIETHKPQPVILRSEDVEIKRQTTQRKP